VKDIEGLVYEVHTTGPLALKSLQIPNGALPPFILLCLFSRMMMILDEVRKRMRGETRTLCWKQLTPLVLPQTPLVN